MKKTNQANLKRRITIMLIITLFLMPSLVVGCGKKNVNTVSVKEDALEEEAEESEKIEQDLYYISAELMFGDGQIQKAEVMLILLPQSIQRQDMFS